MKRKKITLLIICLLSLKAYSQQDFTTKDIAAMEAAAHGRIVEGRGESFASNNFDVNYYRCRWEIDPAVRYISGSVTVYYTITSATSSIVLDMMNTLVADSVEQRTANLVFTQVSNTIEIKRLNNLI